MEENKSDKPRKHRFILSIIFIFLVILINLVSIGIFILVRHMLHL